MTPKPTTKLPAVILGLGWVSLFTDAAGDMFYPLLPAFLRSLGGGGVALGAMEGIAESLSAAVKYWSGQRSDRAPHKKPFVLFGYGVALIIRPLIAFAAAPWHVILGRSLDRVGKGVRSAPRDAIVARAIDSKRRGHAYGYHQMMDNTGAAIGPLIAFALARYAQFSVREIIAFSFIPGLLAMLTLVFAVKEPAPPPPSTSPAEPAPKLDAPRVTAPVPAEVRRYLAVVGLFTLGASADSFLLLRMTDLGLATAWIPVVWLSLNAVKAITNIPGGRISDRFGRRPTLAVAWVLYAIVYGAMAFTTSVTISWALVLLYGGYYGLAEGGEKAMIADLAPPELRGKSFGALHAVTGLAVLPANALFGALYDGHAPWAFGLSAACAGGAALLLMMTGARGEGTAARAAA